MRDHRPRPPVRNHALQHLVLAELGHAEAAVLVSDLRLGRNAPSLSGFTEGRRMAAPEGEEAVGVCRGREQPVAARDQAQVEINLCLACIPPKSHLHGVRVGQLLQIGPHAPDARSIPMGIMGAKPQPRTVLLVDEHRRWVDVLDVPSELRPAQNLDALVE